MPKMVQTADKWETGCAMAQMRIKDIAAEAGVSPATVSRYLNNRPGQMTEETRARIAAVIERTGYRPRAAARNLRSSRTNLIGVILADCERVEDGVHVNRAERIKPVDIQTLPFPGFPTDMQAQIMVLSALADGSSVITENIFENRFMFASELVRMGADIRIESHHAMIHGVKGFSGAQVTSPDLRGGAALVVAGLIADGTTEVSAIHHIKRGYEQFVEKLQALGAHVEHASVPDPVIY